MIVEGLEDFDLLCPPCATDGCLDDGCTREVVVGDRVFECGHACQLDQLICGPSPDVLELLRGGGW